MKFNLFSFKLLYNLVYSFTKLLLKLNLILELYNPIMYHQWWQYSIHIHHSLMRDT